MTLSNDVHHPFNFTNFFVTDFFFCYYGQDTSNWVVYMKNMKIDGHCDFSDREMCPDIVISVLPALS